MICAKCGSLSASTTCSKCNFDASNKVVYYLCIPADSVLIPSSTEKKKADPKVLYALAVKFEKGYGVPKDYSRAFKAYLDAAEQDHTDAQYAVGNFYFEGKGIQQNFDEALIWYAKAAEKGHGGAMERIAQCYHDGLGVPANNAKEQYWLSMAEKKRPIPRKEKPAPISFNADHWRELAQMGNAEAQFKLGKCYENGSGGVARDASKAAEWYIRSANLGYPKAMVEAGRCYEKGIGVIMSFRNAEKYYERATQQDRDPSSAYVAKGLLAVLRGSQDSSPEASRSILDHIADLFRR